MPLNTLRSANSTTHTAWHPTWSSSSGLRRVAPVALALSSSCCRHAGHTRGHDRKRAERCQQSSAGCCRVMRTGAPVRAGTTQKNKHQHNETKPTHLEVLLAWHGCQRVKPKFDRDGLAHSWVALHELHLAKAPRITERKVAGGSGRLARPRPQREQQLVEARRPAAGLVRRAAGAAQVAVAVEPRGGGGARGRGRGVSGACECRGGVGVYHVADGDGRQHVRCMHSWCDGWQEVGAPFTTKRLGTACTVASCPAQPGHCTYRPCIHIYMPTLQPTSFLARICQSTAILSSTSHRQPLPHHPSRPPTHSLTTPGPAHLCSVSL
jgi:hypothetical protein